MAAEIKLTEAWKSLNIKNYTFQLEPNNPGRNDGGREIRMSSIKMWKDDSKSRAASESMSRDTARLWNTVPDSIKTAKTLCGAKRLIKLYSVR